MTSRIDHRVSRLEAEANREADKGNEVTLETLVLASYGDPAALAILNRPGREPSAFEILLRESYGGPGERD